MKLKCTFDFVDMGDEIIAVPIGPNSDEIGGVFKLNKEGMEILKLLNDGLSREEVIDHLSSTYDNNRTELENYVDKTIGIFQQAGILIE